MYKYDTQEMEKHCTVEVDMEVDIIDMVRLLHMSFYYQNHAQM